MTEPEWLACTSPGLMLGYLRGKASDRKLRLFGAACCREVWHLLPDARCRKAVESAERYADGVIGVAEFAAAREEAFEASWRFAGGNWAASAVTALCGASRRRAVWNAGLAHAARARGEWLAVSRAAAPKAAHDTAREEQCGLVRDIFGNPFRPVTVEPSWLTPTVTSLAQAIYDDRAFDRLPILADALEEAGCANVDVLTHGRGPGPHARGCWVVDLLTGRR